LQDAMIVYAESSGHHRLLGLENQSPVSLQALQEDDEATAVIVTAVLYGMLQ